MPQVLIGFKLLVRRGHRDASEIMTVMARVMVTVMVTAMDGDNDSDNDNDTCMMLIIFFSQGK